MSQWGMKITPTLRHDHGHSVPVPVLTFDHTNLHVTNLNIYKSQYVIKSDSVQNIYIYIYIYTYTY